MKTIGLLGGMSWESTVPYYRRINERVRQRLGGLHSARILLYSVDFAEIERLQREARWREAGTLLAGAARSLEAAGADLLLLCTNTMHKVAPAIEAAVSIPLLHIADPTATHIRQLGLRTVGLLGTRFTMEQDFYRARLESTHGLQVVIPELGDREQVHRVIYEELCLGVVAEDSRRAYRAVIGRLAQRGAQGVILGCTEIALLISPADTPIPLFDTTLIHADSAVDLALGGPARLGGRREMG